MMPHRAGFGLLATAAAAAAGWYFWQARDVPHFGFLLDDAIYFSSAKAWAQGDGHKIPGLPGEPWQTKYPFGYPWLLQWIWRAWPEFPANLALAAVVGAVLYAVQSAVTAQWNRWIAAAAAVNPVSLFYGASLMSETAGMCVLMAVFALSARFPAVAGAVAGLAVLIRSASLGLLVAGPVWYLFQRRWRDAARFTVSMLPAVLLWQWWSGARKPRDPSIQMSFYTDYSGYLAASFDPAGILGVVQSNLETALLSAGSLLWFDAGDSITVSYRKTMLALLAVYGIVRWTQREGLSLYTVFAAVYLAMLLPWNFSPNERFLLPLLPLLLRGIWECGEAVARAMLGLWRRAGVADRVVSGAVLGGMAAAGCFWAAGTAESLTGYFPSILAQQRERGRIQQNALDWARTRLPQDAIAVAYQESRFALFTGRHAIGMPLPPQLGYARKPDPVQAYFSQVKETARRHGARYLYMTPWDYELDLRDGERIAWSRRITEDPRWRLLHESAGIRIFELLP